MSENGFTVWIIGLPSAGKTTLGRMLAGALVGQGLKVHQIDGDEVRKGLSADLDYSRRGRHLNNLRTAYVAGLLNRYGVNTVVSQITPYQDTRREVRQGLPRFVEVYLDCPLDQLINRDVKGMYKRALAGEIKNFTGLDDPFEAPVDADLILYTCRENPSESLSRILNLLRDKDWLPHAEACVPPEPESPYTPEEEAVVKARLRDLGYL
ncbi:MAG: adenylyl-sulfate kinase [Deltaproteobacteria bacterium]|nr:adenylyl-sulfate kinase [Deltaproteobacteria bacterium]